MRPPKLVPAEVSFSVHFMTSAMAELGETEQRTQRRAMEAIQRCAWGDRHADFARLMQSEAFLPKVPLDPVFLVPVAKGLRMVAMNAVKAWNRCKFPLRFEEAWESIKGPDRMSGHPSMSGESMRDMALDTEGAPDPWTCVVWEWRNGEYVPTYNYRVAPTGPGGTSPHAKGKAKAMSGMDDEETMPSVFDDIVPGFDLEAVYEFHIVLKLPFPLQDSASLAPPPVKGHVLTPPATVRKPKKATKAKATMAKRTAK